MKCKTLFGKWEVFFFKTFLKNNLQIDILNFIWESKRVLTCFFFFFFSYFKYFLKINFICGTLFFSLYLYNFFKTIFKKQTKIIKNKLKMFYENALFSICKNKKKIK